MVSYPNLVFSPSNTYSYWVFPPPILNFGVSNLGYAPCSRPSGAEESGLPKPLFESAVHPAAVPCAAAYALAGGVRGGHPGEGL
jgi:hypothetical protein